MVSAAAARKTVSVLFCDLADSTVLGERLDPEPLRELLGAWYEEMRIAVERHGGTVEKFIGDAVMAVFGAPARARGRRAAGGAGRARHAASGRAAERLARGATVPAAADPDRDQHRRGRDGRRRGDARHRRRGQHGEAARAGGRGRRDPDRRGRRERLVRHASRLEPVDAGRGEGEERSRRGVARARGHRRRRLVRPPLGHAARREDARARRSFATSSTASADGASAGS